MEEHKQSTSELHVRPATIEDTPFISSLVERFAEVGTPRWRDRELMRQFHKRSASEVVAAIANSTELVLVAEDATGSRLGYIYTVSTNDFFTGEPQGYIADIAVSEQAEGKGVASMLMKHAEAWARTRSFRILALDVFAFNTRARAFYQRLGYGEETLKLIKEL